MFNSFYKSIFILQLITPFEFDDYVKPIILVNFNVVPNTACRVAGWGVTRFASDRLQCHQLKSLLLLTKNIVIYRDKTNQAPN